MIKRTIEILAAAQGPLDIEVIYGGLARYNRGRTSDVASHAGVWPPIDVLRQLLSKSPALHCQQGDDFRLQAASGEMQSKPGVAQIILKALEECRGVASRSELAKAVVQDQNVNPITFAVTLSISPLIRQIDRGIFAIRGWPVDGARLIEALRTVGVAAGSSGQTKDVQVDDDGEVSWLATLTEGAMRNRAATLPAKAGRHLPQGTYSSDSRTVTLIESRVNGLIRWVRDLGGRPGCTYRVALQPARRTIHVDILDPGEDDDAAED